MPTTHNLQRQSARPSALENENLTQWEGLGGAYEPRLEVEQPRDGVDGILFSETLAAEGAVVFAKACQLGLEGTSYRVFLCLAVP
jgi:hypothetical protein